jgi:hypothetical protein
MEELSANSARVPRGHAPSARAKAWSPEGAEGEALFLKGDRVPPGGRTLPKLDGSRAGRVKIRCPRCGFEPRKNTLWSCTCFHRWNTFETGGICPSCQKQWLETQCPRCKAWSPHESWYVEDDPPAA